MTIRPQMVILLGNRPRGKSHPWGIIPQGNDSARESFLRGIIPLGKHPPGGSFPWGMILTRDHSPGESSPWGIIPLGNHPPGEYYPQDSSPWGRKRKNLEPRARATLMPTIQKPWSGGASHSKCLWKWLSQIQVPSHSQAVGVGDSRHDFGVSWKKRNVFQLSVPCIGFLLGKSMP